MNKVLEGRFLAQFPHAVKIWIARSQFQIGNSLTPHISHWQQEKKKKFL